MIHLWKGAKNFDNLKYVDLRHSKGLIMTPDFTGVPRLEILNLCSCNNLVELPSSIGQLTGLMLLDLSNCESLIQLPSLEEMAYFHNWHTLKVPSSIIGKLPMLEELYLKGYNEHMLDRLGLGSQNIMTTTNEHLFVKHGVHKTYMNAEDCYSLEPSQALHGQCSLSQPWSQWPQYNESSVGVTFTILNRYLQGLRFPKSGYETSIERKEDGFRIPFQIIIPGYEIPWCHQRSGNSISIGLPPNWCNSKWMGFALCASLEASYSHISVEEFDIGETFGLKARVIARGDTPHSYYVTEISCSTKLVARHIWLLHLSRDDWFATARSGEFNQIEVVFESTRPGLYVRKCGLRLVYEQDVEMFIQTMCSTNLIAFKGWDGSHDEFDNLSRDCDDYNNNEPSAICSSSEGIESFISSVNGVQISYPSNINVSHQKICHCPAQASLKTIFTDENFGRRFWSCGKYKQNVNCGFFEWEDPEMCPYGRRVIHQLQECLEKIVKDKVDQDELAMLREKERMLCSDRDKLKKLLVVHHKENKNLRIALLFSWITFVIIVTVMIWCNRARVEHKKMLP